MDGIELATWILAIVTTVYAGATIALFLETRSYSKKTRDLVDENRKERIRPVVDQIVNKFLLGKTRVLEMEAKEPYDFGTPPDGSVFRTVNLDQGFSDENFTGKIFVKSMLKGYAEIGPLVQRHNQLVNKLRKLNEELFKALCTQEFKTTVQKSIEEYNVHAQIKISYSAEKCAVDLVNLYPRELPFRTLPEDEVVEPWYNENKNLLEQFCTRPEVRQIRENRDRTVTKLKKNAKELREELEKIREKLVAEYMI